MKYLKQFLIILTISFVGEVLKMLLPLPVPASIYGMVILFVLLFTGILKLDAVKDVGKFLIEIMPVMFIPAGVGLMSSWGLLKPLLVPVIVITVVSLVLVMICGGRVTQLIIRHGKKGMSLSSGMEKMEKSISSGTEKIEKSLSAGTEKMEKSLSSGTEKMEKSLSSGTEKRIKVYDSTRIMGEGAEE